MNLDDPDAKTGMPETNAVEPECIMACECATTMLARNDQIGEQVVSTTR